jgi:hypothetical protein
MKKLLLVTAFCLCSLNVFSQEKINTNDLIGYWAPDQESTQLFFWKDINGKLQVQEISGTDGEPIDTIAFNVNVNSILVKTIFVPNKWVTESVFTFIDKTTLKCVITGDGNGIIIYTKIK